MPLDACCEDRGLEEGILSVKHRRLEPREARPQTCVLPLHVPPRQAAETTYNPRLSC